MDAETFEDLKQGAQELRDYLDGKLEPSRVTVTKTPNPKTIRNKLKLTQAEFSALLGVSKRTYCNWEYGERAMPPIAKKMLRIADKNPDVLLSV